MVIFKYVSRVHPAIIDREGFPRTALSKYFIHYEEWKKMRKYLEKRKDLLVLCDEIEAECVILNHHAILIIGSKERSGKGERNG